MDNDEGLQGCWFIGMIESVKYQYALVRYFELNASEETTDKLREWFPLPGAKPQAKLPAEFTKHTATDAKLRPRSPAAPGAPPPTAADIAAWFADRTAADRAAGGAAAAGAAARSMPSSSAVSGKAATQNPFAVGMLVEVFADGGWWETQVSAIADTSVSVPVGEDQLLAYSLDNVRKSMLWHAEYCDWQDAGKAPIASSLAYGLVCAMHAYRPDENSNLLRRI